MKLSIIIPWQNKEDDPRYAETVEFVINYYRSLNIGEVIVGTYPVDDQPLNRSRLRNEGAKLATGDVLVFIDAEIIVPTAQLLEAVKLAGEAPGIVFPFSHGWTYCTPEQTRRIYDGEAFEQFIRTEARTSYYQFGRTAPPRHWWVAPATVITRGGFDEIGGWDEDFIGWGEEDRDLNWRAHHLLGPLRLVDGGYLHLNHTDREDKVDSLAAFTEGTPERRMFLANVARYREKALAVYRPKIAVYSPAKNEEANVEGWVASTEGADFVILTDTGSTDATVRVAREAGATVHEDVVVPWRFDVGFNTALDHVPHDVDICIPLALDERLEPGWREELEVAWLMGADKFLFHYQWQPTVSYGSDRIHVRHGYRWKYPVHEVLVGDGVVIQSGVRIIHHQDLKKDRSNDDALIDVMLEENPTDPHSLYCHARQKFHNGIYPEAREGFLEYLKYSGDDQERSEASLMIAEMVWDSDREKWLLKGIAECPSRREGWERLADHYLAHGMNDAARGVAHRLLSIKYSPGRNDYYMAREAWDDNWISLRYFGEH